ncbi:Glycerol-3-phosphate regulon repressor [compost metagenome]
MFLAADHTKFGRNAMVNLGNLNQIHALFTDQEPPEKLMRLMSQHQIACHIC